jgi:dTDP-4-amino-4,6-dideoxygalactose transaminase
MSTSGIWIGPILVASTAVRAIKLSNPCTVHTNFGPKERQFARALGEYLGPDLHVATLANGTLALIAALHATFGPGTHDRYLLMPSFTFIAVAQAALWTGYRTWFIDIDADTWQPSAPSGRAVLEHFRDRVAGILLANVLGVGNPQIVVWEDLAAERELTDRPRLGGWLRLGVRRRRARRRTRPL